MTGIQIFTPISDAPIWVLFLALFFKPKIYMQKGTAIQYYEFFGNKYWTRKFEEPKGSSYKAEQQLKNRKLIKGKK